jgi:hypothetical protein
MKIIEFSTFITNGKSAAELLDELKKKSLKVSDYVESLVEKGLISTTKGEKVRLVGIRGSDVDRVISQWTTLFNLPRNTNGKILHSRMRYI